MTLWIDKEKRKLMHTYTDSTSGVTIEIDVDAVINLLKANGLVQ